MSNLIGNKDIYQYGIIAGEETRFKKGLIPWNKGIKKFVDIDVAKRMYLDEKKSTYDISKIFNVSQKTIENRLKEANVILRKRGQHTNHTIEKIRQKHFEQFNNMTLEEKEIFETKRVEALKLKGAWNKGLKGSQVAWNKGLPISEEQRLNHSKYMKQYYRQHPEAKELIKEARSKQIFPKKDSSIEIKIQGYLKQLGIEFFTHQYINIKHAYQCDIFIPSMNLIIECDGTYWHHYPTRRDIDNIRTKELWKSGFKVLRLWEFEINEMTLKEFNNRLMEVRF